MLWKREEKVGGRWIVGPSAVAIQVTSRSCGLKPFSKLQRRTFESNTIMHGPGVAHTFGRPRLYGNDAPIE
jgi:hypothetical protein